MSYQNVFFHCLPPVISRLHIIKGSTKISFKAHRSVFFFFPLYFNKSIRSCVSLAKSLSYCISVMTDNASHSLMCLRKPNRSKSEPYFRENTAKWQLRPTPAALPGLMGKNNLGQIARYLSRSLPEQALHLAWVSDNVLASPWSQSCMLTKPFSLLSLTYSLFCMIIITNLV